MALNFGQNLFEGGGIFLGYRQSASNQKETFSYKALTAIYATIYTVTTGKTGYISSIIVGNSDEFNSLVVYIKIDGTLKMVIPLQTAATNGHHFGVPLKLSSGSVVTAKEGGEGMGGHLTLIGWEE